MSTFPSYSEFDVTLLAAWPPSWKLEPRRLGTMEVVVVEHAPDPVTGRELQLIDIASLLSLFHVKNLHEYFEVLPELPADPRFYFYKPTDPRDSDIFSMELCLITWREFFVHLFIYPKLPLYNEMTDSEAFLSSPAPLGLFGLIDSADTSLLHIHKSIYGVTFQPKQVERESRTHERESRLRKGLQNISRVLLGDAPASPAPNPPATPPPASSSQSTFRRIFGGHRESPAPDLSSSRAAIGSSGSSSRERTTNSESRIVVGAERSTTPGARLTSHGDTAVNVASYNTCDKPLPAHDDELRLSRSSIRLSGMGDRSSFSAMPTDAIINMVRSNDLGGIREQLKFIDVNSITMVSSRRTLLMVAAEEGFLDMTNELLRAGALVNEQDNHGWTALHFAANQSQLSICHRLLLVGADPRLITSSGNTALHYLASKGHIGIGDPYLYLVLFMIILQKYPGIANIRNQRGETAAHRACMHGGKQSLMFFVKFASIDLSIKTHKGEDLLIYAVRSSGNNLPLIHYLLELPGTQWDCEAALQAAILAHHDDVIKLLEAHRDAKPIELPAPLPLSKKKGRIDQRLRALIPPNDTLLHSFAGQLELHESNKQISGKLFLSQTRIGFCSSKADDQVVLLDWSNVICIESWSSLAFDDGIRVLSSTSSSSQLILSGLIAPTATLAQLRDCWFAANPSLTQSQLDSDHQAAEREITAAFARDLALVSLDNPCGFQPTAELYCPETDWWLLEEVRLVQAWEESGFLVSDTAFLQALQSRDKALENLIFQGIPAPHRKMIWGHLTGANAKRNAARPDYWPQLSAQTAAQSETPHQIEIDLTRTFPEHPLFCGDAKSLSGLRALRHILVAYSLRDPKVGYCQAMNYLTGLLTIFLSGDLEATFWNMCGIVENLLPDYYTGSMCAAVVDQEVFDYLIPLELPELVEWWKQRGIEWHFLKFATVFPWFLCVFGHGAKVIPLHVLLWVWDNFFYHGSAFLFDVALTILKICLPKLMEVETPEASRDLILSEAKKISDKRAFASFVAVTRLSLREKGIDINNLRYRFAAAKQPFPAFVSFSSMEQPKRIRSTGVLPLEIFQLIIKYSSKAPSLDLATIDADSFVHIYLCLRASAGAEFTGFHDSLLRIFAIVDTDNDGKVSIVEFITGALLFFFRHDTPDDALSFCFQLLTQLEAPSLSLVDKFIQVLSAILFQSPLYLNAHSLGAHRSHPSTAPKISSSDLSNPVPLTFAEFLGHLKPYPKLLYHIQHPHPVPALS